MGERLWVVKGGWAKDCKRGNGYGWAKRVRSKGGEKWRGLRVGKRKKGLRFWKSGKG